jgi:hypothetical protein
MSLDQRIRPTRAYFPTAFPPGGHAAFRLLPDGL